MKEMTRIEEEAKLQKRSIDEQAEHWIKIGRAIETSEEFDYEQESQFDDLFNEFPEAGELLKHVQEQLTVAIELTNKTTDAVETMRKGLSSNQKLEGNQ